MGLLKKTKKNKDTSTADNAHKVTELPTEDHTPSQKYTSATTSTSTGDNAHDSEGVSLKDATPVMFTPVNYSGVREYSVQPWNIRQAYDESFSPQDRPHLSSAQGSVLPPVTPINTPVSNVHPTPYVYQNMPVIYPPFPRPQNTSSSVVYEKMSAGRMTRIVLAAIGIYLLPAVLMVFLFFIACIVIIVLQYQGR